MVWLQFCGAWVENLGKAPWDVMTLENWLVQVVAHTLHTGTADLGRMVSAVERSSSV